MNMNDRLVGLIIPPSPFLLDERVFISLGILRVAANLEQHNIKVNLYDLSGISNYLDVVESYIATTKHDWIGLTATTPQLPAAINISQTIRRISQTLGFKQKIVLGGPHVTLTYAAVKSEIKNKISWAGRAQKSAKMLEDQFDVLVCGDGELAALEIFSEHCPKVIDADNKKARWFLTNQLYEELPFPARHLVDVSTYHYNIEGHNSTSLIAQLGCPFHCGFCGGRSSASLRLIRTRSVNSIISEIEKLHKEYGFTGFMFYDDELNVNKQLIELMNSLESLQLRLGIEFRLRGFIKAELFTENQAKAMYNAGFRWLLCGFESANERILKNIEKIATLEDNARAIEFAKKHNLKVKALMSVGHPGESYESINDTKEWLIKMEVDDFDCTVITTYPGTPYFDLSSPHHLLKNIWQYSQPDTGDKLYSYDLDYTVISDYYKGDPRGGYKAYVFTDYLSPEEIVNLRDNVEKEVRQKLNIPYNPSSAALRFEHSMGQSLPENIFKR